MQQNSREIRLYPNRRLYDPATASYITFEHVYDLLREGVAVTVKDSVKGKDCTRRVLIDLVIRQEQNGSDSHKHCLTDNFLQDLIRAGAREGEDVLMLSKFLDHTIQELARTK